MNSNYYDTMKNVTVQDKYQIQQAYFTNAGFRERLHQYPEMEKMVAAMGHDGTSGGFSFNYTYLGNNASTTQTYVSSLGTGNTAYGYTSAGQALPSSFILYFGIQRFANSSTYQYGSSNKKNGIMIGDISIYLYKLRCCRRTIYGFCHWWKSCRTWN